MNRQLLAVTLVSVAAICGGCDETSGGGDGDQQPVVNLKGSLGRATFTYGCASTSDAQCNVDADLAPVRETSPFPRIAVGSRFQLTANAVSGQMATPLGVDAVSATFMTRDADAVTFLAERPGVASVFAIANDTPLDFADLEITAPVALSILQATEAGDFRGAEIDLDGSEVSASADQSTDFKFRAVVLDDQGEILAGALPCAWTTSDSEVARITTDPASNIVTLTSGVAGTAEVSVAYGDYEGVIALEVAP